MRPLVLSRRPPPQDDEGKLIAVIGDEDTVTGFLLAGVGQRDARGANFLVVDAKTAPEAVAAALSGFLARDDVGLVIINQPVADTVRGTLDAHKAAVPMVLEIPATGAPYDASKDAIMKRVLAMLGDAA